jgi:hypothetical protein
VNDQAKNARNTLNDVNAMTGAAKESFDNISKAFAGWLHDANNLQAETFHFMSNRFSKDLQMMSRFGACRKPEDFISLQSELVTQLVSDYMEEGAKLMTLFGDMTKNAISAAPTTRQ